jgi:hypothetical protein
MFRKLEMPMFISRKIPCLCFLLVLGFALLISNAAPPAAIPMATLRVAATQVETTQPATTQSVVTTQPTTAPIVDDNKQMEDLWADLEKQEPWSTRAILDFYDKPASTVAFFKDHLKPLKLDQKEMEDAFTALASDEEKVWKPAYEKLNYFDPRLNMDIEALLSEVTEPLARTRLAAILTGCQPDQWKGYDVSLVKNGNWGYLSMRNGNSQSNYGIQEKVSELDGSKPQWQRTDRALVLLQHIGTPGAIAILKDLATGNPSAQPTKIAKAALQSLGEPVKW